MKKLLSILCAAGMTAALLAGCGKAQTATTDQTAGDTQAAETTTETTDAADTQAASGDTLIALITMDSLDQHWVE